MSSQTYQQFAALMSRSAYAEAIALAESQLARSDTDRVFWQTRLSAALAAARKYDAALEAADAALRLSPRNSWALVARGEAHLGLARPREAYADFSEAAADGRTAGRARGGMLQALAALKNWADMLSLVNQWDMPETEKYPWRIKAFSGLDRHDDALDICRAWLKEKPDHPPALWELARLETEAEGVDAVRERVGRLAKIPGKPPVYGEIYASLCRKSGVADAAVRQYEKMTSTVATPRLLRQKAFALAKSGHENEAIPLMEELLRLDPRDMYIHSAFVAACKRVREIERAWSFYHELSAKYPDEKGLLGRIKGIRKFLENPPPHPEP